MKTKPKEKLIPPDELLIKEFGKGLKRWNERSRKEHRDKSVKAWNVFRVSEIGACQAAITRDWLGQTGEEETLQGILRMHDGSWTHKEVREIFELSDLKLDSEEEEVEKTYKINLEGVVEVSLKLMGHMDNAFRHGNQRIILDFKKASEFSYEKMEDGTLSEAYWDQMQGYLDLTDLPLGIFFIKGVHGKVNAITVERDKEYFHKQVLPRLARTALKRKRNEIGTRDFHYGLFPCTFCKHCEACWNPSESSVQSDKILTLKPTDPGARDVLVALQHDTAYRGHQEAADKAKSAFRDLAIKVIEKAKTSKVRLDEGGGITWVTGKRASVSLLPDKKEAAIKAKMAVKTETTISYPLCVKSKQDDDE